MKNLFLFLFLLTPLYSQEFRVFYSSDYETRTEAKYIKYCPDSLFLLLQNRDESMFEEKLTTFSIEDRIYVTKEHKKWVAKKHKAQSYFGSQRGSRRNPKKVYQARPTSFKEGYLGALFEDHWTNPNAKFKKDHWVIINHLNLQKRNYDSPIEMRPDEITGQRIIIDFKTKKRLCPPSGCK